MAAVLSDVLMPDVTAVFGQELMTSADYGDVMAAKLLIIGNLKAY